MEDETEKESEKKKEKKEEEEEKEETAYYFLRIFFFFYKEFQLIASAPDDALYYQTKTLIDFWCRWWLNLKSLIQLSETLLVELIKTHYF